MSRAWFGRVVGGVVEGCVLGGWKGGRGRVRVDAAWMASGVEGRGRAGGGAVVGVDGSGGGWICILEWGCGRIEGVYSSAKGGTVWIRQRIGWNGSWGGDW